MTQITIGCRIPKDFFLTSGAGESDVTIHAGSFHHALKDAEIERCNIMTYSSILPKIANEIKKPELVHGSVMETICAVADAEKGKRATAGIIFGWLYDKKTKEKYGGFVCEYHGGKTEEETKECLRQSMNELYCDWYKEQFDLRDTKIITKSITPKKAFGTALVAICFVNYEVPII